MIGFFASAPYDLLLLGWGSFTGSSASPTAWIFAFWIATAALGAPLLLGALLGSRWSGAQRTVVRLMLILTPLVLVAGVLLPDPFEGRPIVELASFEPALPQLPAPKSFDSELPGAAEAFPRPDTPHRFDVPLLGPLEAGPLVRSAGDTDEEIALEAILGDHPTFPGNWNGGEWDATHWSNTAEANDALHADLLEEQLELVRGAFEGESSEKAEGLRRGPFGGGFADDAETDRFERTLATTPLDPTPPATLDHSIPRTDRSGPEAHLTSIRHPTSLHAPSQNPATRSSAERSAMDIGFAPVRSPAASTGPIGGSDAEPGALFEMLVAAFLFIWAIGVIIGWIRVAGSAWLLTRWRRTSNTLGSTRGVPNIDPTAAPLPVRIIPGLGSAAAVGVLSPEIWLPAHWSARLDRASLHALLGHETAHHRGRDPLWRLLGACVVALLWPHPLVHSLRRREEHLSELEADRLVIASGAGPRRYAELLAHLAAETTRAPSPLAAGVLGTRSPLERRIRMILVLTPKRSRRSAGWAAPTVLGALCFTAIGLSAFFPLVGNACDPVEKETSKVEFVLEEADGQWIAKTQSPQGQTQWSVAFAPVSAGDAVLVERDGRYAHVSLGNRSLLFDTRSGKMLEPPKRGLSIRTTTTTTTTSNAKKNACESADEAEACESTCEQKERKEREKRERVRTRSLFGAPADGESVRNDPLRVARRIESDDERAAHLHALEERLARMEAELDRRLQMEEIATHRRLADLEAERADRMNHLRERAREMNDRRVETARLSGSERARAAARLAVEESELANLRAQLEVDFGQRVANLHDHAEGQRRALLERLAELNPELHLDRAHAHVHGDPDAEHAHGHALEAHLADPLERAHQLVLTERDSLALRRALAAVEEGLAHGEAQLDRLPDLFRQAEGAIVGLERRADEVEHSLERAIDRLPEILAGLEDLPDILETLTERPHARDDSSREEGLLLRHQLDETRSALEIERTRRLNLEAENRALRQKLEALEKEKRPAAEDLRSALMDQ